MKSYELFSLKDKTAVVTGALGLLGRYHCYALVESGASVIVSDIDEDECIKFACSIGNHSKGIAADITDYNAVLTMKNKILKEYGKIDILVNNAAINDMFENPAMAAEQSKFENYPLEMWKKSLDVNITGTFICSQILGAEMSRMNKGSIINIASTYGMVAPDQSLYRSPDGFQKFYKSAVYPVTKSAVISFTRYLAAYWGDKGVRVNSLSPGGVENKQDEYFINNYSRKTPLGRMAAPSDFKGALIFLASDASGYMTGANLVVDGGFTAW